MFSLRPISAQNFKTLRRNCRLISTAPKVIFSGIQPTGVPHLGNFAGAIRQWVRLQNEPQESCKRLYCVVDLHALTVPQNAQQLRQWRREMLAALLAAGIDPSRSSLFYQSSISAHSEMMWILSCTASMGYLSRMTQWKSKLSLSSESSLQDEGVKASLKLGLFSYPVLQAADILVHRATHVPVGDDQRQHLEFARECVSNFNHAYGAHLVPPETISTSTRRVMSLLQPTQKMSKSHVNPRSRILITDTPEEIKKKIKGALTDSQEHVSYDVENRPGVSNLLEILSMFDPLDRSPSRLADEMVNVTLKELKTTVADAVIAGLHGMREKYNEFLLTDGGKYLDAVEADGAKKAKANADETMAIVREATGL